jgi:hypothetical protein
VFGTGQRFRCNMISAITNRGRLAFMIFRQRFTARVFLNFLRRLLRLTRTNRRKVFLIVDGHPVHKSRPVSRWLLASTADLLGRGISFSQLQINRIRWRSVIPVFGGESEK